jgi:hypothetical protein
LAQRLRTWFLRNVLDAVERLHGASAVASLRARLPERLHPHVSLDRLRASAMLDAIPLDDGEDVLLQIESSFGDGTGRALESVGFDLASRALGQAGSVVKRGDLYGTVARLQAFLEHPFDGVVLTFELSRTDGGFKLICGVPQRSRATKIVRYLATGAINAAERFARETTTGELNVVADNIADRATINVRYQGRDATPNEEPPVSKRRSSVRPPGGPASTSSPTLTQQVEQILGNAGMTGKRRASLTLRRASDPGLAKAAADIDSSETPNAPPTADRKR